jgi:DNA polymerase/3'-5' exonuclease PolX
MENSVISRRLREYARYLQRSGEALYRVKAYRRGADAVDLLDRPAYKVYEDHGRKGLEAIPGIGRHLAYTISELINTGEFHPYNDPREFIAPERLVACRPSIDEAMPAGSLFVASSPP